MRPWVRSQEAATSIVNYGETVELIRSDTNYPARRAELQLLLGDVTPLPITYSIMERYADLRRAMRPPHGKGLIGDIDTLIAATALEHDLTTVTLDGDYSRVPGLNVMGLTRTDLMH